MVKRVIVYEAYGKRFDEYDDALKYEYLYEEVEKIMSDLPPRSKAVENGTGVVKHDVSTLNKCLKAFCNICAEHITPFKQWFIDVVNDDLHISHIGRILSDYRSDFPILYKTYYRFDCIDFETGIEFQQPYYVIHQDEFFSQLKNC